MSSDMTSDRFEKVRVEMLLEPSKKKRMIKKKDKKIMEKQNKTKQEIKERRWKRVSVAGYCNSVKLGSTQLNSIELSKNPCETQ